MWLFLESESLTPDEMSQRIGLPYDKTWHKGEARGKTGKVLSTNSWKLESRSILPLIVTHDASQANPQEPEKTTCPMQSTGKSRLGPAHL